MTDELSREDLERIVDRVRSRGVAAEHLRAYVAGVVDALGTDPAGGIVEALTGEDPGDNWRGTLETLLLRELARRGLRAERDAVHERVRCGELTPLLDLPEAEAGVEAVGLVRESRVQRARRAAEALTQADAELRRCATEAEIAAVLRRWADRLVGERWEQLQHDAEVMCRAWDNAHRLRERAAAWLQEGVGELIAEMNSGDLEMALTVEDASGMVEFAGRRVLLRRLVRGLLELRVKRQREALCEMVRISEEAGELEAWAKRLERRRRRLPRWETETDATREDCIRLGSTDAREPRCRRTRPGSDS